MQHIKKIYLYLVSVIALVIAVVGAIMLLNMGLKAWVFTKADQDYYQIEYYQCKANQSVDVSKPVNASEANCTEQELKDLTKQRDERRSAQKQRDASQALSMLVIAAPVWFFHWRLAKREQ
jgi:hypothetical protein